MTKTGILGALTIVASLLLTSCAPSGQLDLEGTTWELSLLEGMSLIADSRITLAFEGDEIRGNSGCNTYFGGYSLSSENGIQFTDIGMTEMACLDPDGLMDQESSYVRLLREATKAILKGNQITLQDASGQDVLVFNATSE